VPTPARHLCALLHEGHVLTDDLRRIPSYDEGHRHTPLARRAAICGDADAVLTAPQLLVHEDPLVLLSVFTPRDGRVPGIWTPISDLAEEDVVLAALSPVAATLAGHAAAPARRPAWFGAGWYDHVERWVDAELQGRGRSRTSRVEPTKVGMLSAVLRVPCDPCPAVWFKASCRHFHAEPALTRLVGELLPEHSPRVIATDDDHGWTLLEEMPGADEDAAPTGLGPATARVAAALQLRSLEHLDRIEAAGVPLRDLTSTRREFDEILTSSVELDQLTHDDLDAARAMRDDVHALLAELDGLGIPDTLVHGDLHTGNVADDGGTAVLYDWSDAAVSHPFLDVVHLGQRLPDDERAAAFAAYREVWGTAYPEADVVRAVELAEHADPIFQMVTYEQIYRACEDASYWEMRGVVARFLRNLPERFHRRD